MFPKHAVVGSLTFQKALRVMMMKQKIARGGGWRDDEPGWQKPLLFLGLGFNSTNGRVQPLLEILNGNWSRPPRLNRGHCDQLSYTHGPGVKLTFKQRPQTALRGGVGQSPVEFYILNPKPALTPQVSRLQRMCFEPNRGCTRTAPELCSLGARQSHHHRLKSDLGAGFSNS